MQKDKNSQNNNLMQVKPSLSLIIPCYNEADRIHLAFEELKAFDAHWGNHYEIIFVDDGSKDDTYGLCLKYANNTNLDYGHISCLQLVQNKGKGGALQKGIAHAKGKMVLTLDADMSTSPLMLLTWLKKIGLKSFNEETIFIGSRVLNDAKVDSKFYRRYAGYIFNFAIKKLTKLPFGDTQCGFKLYPLKYAQDIFGNLNTMGWAHDIEVLLKAKKAGYKTIALPVEWHHVDTDKISVVSDGIKMLISAWKIQQQINKN